MSIKVSYLTSNNTDNGTGFLGHSHGLSVKDYDVPSVSEFQSLQSKVSRCEEMIDDLEQQVQEIQESIDHCSMSVAKCQKASGAASEKIAAVVRAFSDTGKLSTEFKTIVEENLLRIQAENAKMAQAVKRLSESGIVKAEDGAEIEKILSMSKPVMAARKCKNAKSVSAKTRKVPACHKIGRKRSIVRTRKVK